MSFGNMRRSAEQNRNDLNFGCAMFFVLSAAALVAVLLTGTVVLLVGWLT